MKKTLITRIVGFGAVSAVLLFASTALAFTEPAVAPPSGNVAAPVRGSAATNFVPYFNASGVLAQSTLSSDGVSSTANGNFFVTGNLNSSGQLTNIGAGMNTASAATDANLLFGNYPTAGQYQQLYWNGSVQSFRLTAPLIVAGLIQSTSGGIKFPDGTTQTTAAGAGGQWTTSGNNIYSANSGNVGIGNSSPAYKLHVNGDITTGKVVGLIGADRTYTLVQGGSSSSAGGFGIRDEFNNATRVNIDSSGRVGIGTTAPGAKLDVNGSLVANAGYLYTTDGSNGVVASRNGHLFVSSNGSGAVLINNNGNYGYPGGIATTGGTGGLQVYSGGAGSVQQAQIGGPGQTWFTGQNFGIGTSNPREKLEVNGQIVNTGALTAQPLLSQYSLGMDSIGVSSSIYSYGTICAGNSQAGCGGTGGVVISGSNIKFPDGTTQSTAAGAGQWTVSGNNIYNANTGNVGIGTTNPGKKLETVGEVVTRSSSGIGPASSFVADTNGANFWVNGSYDPTNPASGWAKILTLNTGTTNVGINTATPAYKLDVVGDVNTTGCYRVNGTCLGGGTLGGSGTTSYIPMFTNSSTLGSSSVTSNGVSSTANGNFFVSGTRSIAALGNNGLIQINGDTGGWDIGTHFLGSSGTDLGGFGAYGSANALNYLYAGSSFSNPTAVFTQTGNVGIGTAAPAAKLDVNGGVKSTALTVNGLGNDYIHINDGSTDGNLITAITGNHVSNTAIFGTNSNAPNRTVGTTNYGVEGTAAGFNLQSDIPNAADPSTTLVAGVDGEVNGGWSGIGVRGYAVNPANYGFGVVGIGGRVGVYGKTTYSATGINGYGVYCDAQGTNALCGGTRSWVPSSDQRLKHNITNFSDALSKMLNLRPVNFAWNSDPQSKNNIGFIAQDVMKILPDAVVMGANGYYGLNYDSITAVTVGAVKELNAKVDDLSTKVDALQKQNADLEARISALEAKLK